MSKVLTVTAIKKTELEEIGSYIANEVSYNSFYDGKPI
jgi:hypothetical protein